VEAVVVVVGQENNGRFVEGVTGIESLKGMKTQGADYE
jgi:hypothetical protein